MVWSIVIFLGVSHGSAQTLHVVIHVCDSFIMFRTFKLYHLFNYSNIFNHVYVFIKYTLYF